MAIAKSLQPLKDIRKKSRAIERFIDESSFTKIFTVWVILIVLFGVVYFLFQNSDSHLIYAYDGTAVSFLDSIYFSFVTATSTGFGDIWAQGYGKIIAILEVLMGLTIFAVVTSKLVSIKQDVILNEIYEISISERLNRIRSSLYLFRININKKLQKIDEKTIRVWEIDDLWSEINSLEHTLKEINDIFRRGVKSHYTKMVSETDAEIIMDSVYKSLVKVRDLFAKLNKSGIDWKKKITMGLTNSCIELAQIIPQKVLLSYTPEQQKRLKEINAQINSVCADIPKLMTEGDQ